VRGIDTMAVIDTTVADAIPADDTLWLGVGCILEPDGGMIASAVYFDSVGCPHPEWLSMAEYNFDLATPCYKP
jgi:hypothetical protein